MYIKKIHNASFKHINFVFVLIQKALKFNIF